jgi:hypothetical protein
MSYWQTMRRIDSRVSSLTAWEKESKKDPFFPLSVKWQPLGKTVGDVIEETLRGVARATPPTSASELAQLISLAPGRGSSRKWLFLSGIE